MPKIQGLELKNKAMLAPCERLIGDLVEELLSYSLQIKRPMEEN